MATSPFKVENVTPTTADISLNGVVKLAIREGHISTNIPAGEDAPDTALVTMADLRISGGHLFQTVEHNGPLETIPQGCIPANGQKVYASMYPFQMSLVEAGHQFVVPEHEWQAGTPENPDAHKGKWSLGGTDAYGRWYRAPKWNRDGAYRAPFLRGSEIGVDAGVIVSDAMRNIVGGITNLNPIPGPTGGGGAFTVTNAGVNATNGVGALSGVYNYTFNAANALPAGTTTDPITGEFRPRYHGVIMCIRMFGTVSNPGSVDAVQLATDLAIANAKIATLESELEESIGFTIIYPNGGTAGSPANITIDSRYISTNPFPGSACLVVPEVLAGGIWGDPGWNYDGAGSGARAHCVDGVGIVVITGNSAVVGNVKQTGGAFPVGTALATSAPCRVKVWKLKGSM